MGIVDQAVRYGVGDRGIPDLLMPVIHGQLADDDR